MSRGISANLDLAFHPSSELLAGPGPDHTVTIWKLTTGAKNYLPGHTDQVLCVAFRPPHGDLLVSAGKDGMVRFWDPATGKPVRDLAKAHNGKSVEGLTFSPDGRLLATVGADEKVRLWDVGTGEQRYEFATVYWAHGRMLRRIAFSPDGRLFACGEGKTVKVWDVATGQPLALARQAPRGVGRQRGREATLAEGVQLPAAGLRFFFTPSRTSLARAALAGFCLCCTIAAVRR